MINIGVPRSACSINKKFLRAGGLIIYFSLRS
jgi:hypothetical protein